MGWIKDAWYWVLAKDRSLDADQKLSRWTNLTAAVSVVVSVAGWLIGLLFSVPWQLGLLSGLVAWVVLLNTVVTRGRGEVRKTEATAAEELEQVTARLYKVEQERDELRAENERLTDQSGEELKQRALQWSSELFRFAQERDENAPPEATLQWSGGIWDALKESMADPKTQERTNYDEETKRLYGERYGGDVGAVLDALQRREWLDPEKRKRLEEDLENPIVSPTQAIRQIAQRLAAIGKRL